MTITTPGAYTPSSPAQMPSRHTTPPPLSVPTLSPRQSKRQLDKEDKLTGAGLKKQNSQMDGVGASFEQKKRFYSQGMYEYTRAMCEEAQKAIGLNNSRTSSTESAISMSSLSLKGSNEAPIPNQHVTAH